jgi:hypothetical protein
LGSYAVQRLRRKEELMIEDIKSYDEFLARWRQCPDRWKSRVHFSVLIEFVYVHKDLCPLNLDLARVNWSKGSRAREQDATT